MPELVTQADQILEMSAKTLEANLSGKPIHVQQDVQRIIAAVIEGKLKPAGPPLALPASDPTRTSRPDFIRKGGRAADPGPQRD